MNPRIYVDTSVLGGVFDSEFREWSIRLLDEFREGRKTMVLSLQTLSELDMAPPNVQEQLDTIPKEHREMAPFDDDAKALSDKYMEEGVITPRFITDAQHIAIATISRVDALVSWNFKHIVNLKRIKLYNSINVKNGYQAIEIRSPREVLDD